MRRKNWWFPEESLQWVEQLSKARRIPEQEVANWGITVLRTLLESMPEDRKEELLNRAIEAIKQLPMEPPKP